MALTEMMMFFFAFLFMNDFRDHTGQTNRNILSKGTAILFLQTKLKVIGSYVQSTDLRSGSNYASL